MKIIILGLGKVGTEILALCNRVGLEVKAIISRSDVRATHRAIEDIPINKGDVVIDFSSPEDLIKRVDFIGKQQADIVMGTTGWDAYKSEIQEVVKKCGIGFAYTPNYLPEVHAFWSRIDLFASKLSFKNDEKFHAKIYEKRFYTKHSPSGTAKNIIKILSHKKNVLFSEENDFFCSFGGENPIDITVKFSSHDIVPFHLEILAKAAPNKKYAAMALKTAQWLGVNKGFFELNFSQIKKIDNLTFI